MSYWTDKEHQTAVKLWNKGLSATAIGLRLGKTRNAIIGHLHRAGYKRGDTCTKNEATKRQIHRKPKRARVIPQFDTEALPKGKPEDVTAVSFNDMDFATQCSFIPAHVDPKQTDQDTPMYCGAERIPGLAWCHSHCLRCYQPIYLESKGIKVSVPAKAHVLA